MYTHTHTYPHTHTHTHTFTYSHSHTHTHTHTLTHTLTHIQMCINVANEQLQHYFNEHVFQWEQEEGAREGIAMETISYPSNWPVVDLFLEVRATMLPYTTSSKQALCTYMYVS